MRSLRSKKAFSRAPAPFWNNDSADCLSGWSNLVALFVTIVLDGVGIGYQPDAGNYGDVGSDTLGHVCSFSGPSLPTLGSLGLGCIAALDGVPCTPAPRAAYGMMREVSAGKDSTTGHWELAGIQLSQPFPTYPEGFPDELIERFCREAGCSDVLGNMPASGTEIIEMLGAEHVRTGHPIVYTSADSVFQVAAHTSVIPLDRLYHICDIARRRVCVGEHGVGRVIARPFEGEEGYFTRISGKRKDYSRRPEREPLQLQLQESGVLTVSIGKVADLFGGLGFDEQNKTSSNQDGMFVLQHEIERLSRAGQDAFIWVNLIDFDQEYGHRNDPDGFARSLEEFDYALAALLETFPQDSRLFITADHGNDPTFPGTDHTREHVPYLMVNAPDGPKGLRTSFADHAATVADFFGVPWQGHGEVIA
ncbi:MAG: phosphopentomutase [Bacteroidetes bacterium]|nr:phosphopentomutase [Bacteroidota bacterium]